MIKQPKVIKKMNKAESIISIALRAYPISEKDHNVI